MRKLLIVWCCVLSSLSLQASDELDSLYLFLDQCMADREQYEAKKIARIDNIKAILANEDISNTERHHLINRLITEYSTLSFDSTLYYINKNLADPEINVEAFNETILMQANLFAKSGAYKESMDIAAQAKRDALDRKGSVRYFDVYRKIYEDLYFYSSLDKNREKYLSLYIAYTDSVKAVLEPGSRELLGILEKEYRDARQLDSCEIINAQRFEGLKMGTAQYSMVAFERSLIYELRGHTKRQIENLILSAASDIQASIKDYASLTQLALLLFEQGEIEKAYKYIQFSSQDAEYFNSRLRFIEISNILPVITTAHENIINEQNKELKKYLTIISVLSVILAGFFLVLLVQIGRIRQAKNKLHQANASLKNLNDELRHSNQSLQSLNQQLVITDKVKEQYIANFLDICSEFIDKLENYQRMVKRLVSARKYEELVQKASSSEFIEAEVQAFYHTFDTTFLNIYPDFVERINALLQDDKKIELKNEESLNTELRIFALIRLGIEDSSKISKLLRYSVNTIYNYRAKIKNWALSPREEFEQKVMQIDAFTNQSDQE